MISYFVSLFKDLRGTKIINSKSIYVNYNLCRIERMIIQLLDELNKKIHVDNKSIVHASKLDLEVLLGMINANIEKRKVIEFVLVLPGIFIAMAIAGVSLIYMGITFFAVLITLVISETIYTNRLERLILAKELLEVYIKEKFI